MPSISSFLSVATRLNKHTVALSGSWKTSESFRIAKLKIVLSFLLSLSSAAEDAGSHVRLAMGSTQSDLKLI